VDYSSLRPTIEQKIIERANTMMADATLKGRDCAVVIKISPSGGSAPTHIRPAFGHNYEVALAVLGMLEGGPAAFPPDTFWVVSGARTERDFALAVVVNFAPSPTPGQAYTDAETLTHAVHAIVEEVLADTTNPQADVIRRASENAGVTQRLPRTQ